MFFVLNVGRSGSRTIAQVLSQSPNCTCLHEPTPRLLDETHGYLEGTVSHDQVVERLRSSRSERDNEVRGETANRLSLVIPPLREAFPDADLLWLVRDGRAMVSSALQRGWYGAHADASRADWDRTRPTAQHTGDADRETWDSWTPFERICWYWARINTRIREQADDPFLVRLEDLDEQVGAVAERVGVEPVDFVVTRANRRYEEQDPERPFMPLQANAVHELFTVRDWTDEQHEIFARHCGDLMDELYPAWRDESPAEPTPPTVGADRPTEAGPTLRAVHEQLGELRILQDEYQAVHRDRDQLRRQVRSSARKLEAMADRTRGAEQRAAELQDQVDRLRERLDEVSERARDDHDGMREALNEARATRDHERARREAITSSRAYRAGRVLARGAAAGRTVARKAKGLVGAGSASDAAVTADPVRATDGTVAASTSAPIVTVPDPTGGLDPVVVLGILVFGSEPEPLETLIEQVREIQERHPGTAVFYVTDSETFHLFRTANVVFEHVPPRARWSTHASGSYDAYRARRLALLEEAYRPDAMLAVDASEGARDATLALVESALVGQS